MTICPMCAEDVGASDVVCPHCGSLLRAPGASSNAPTQAPVASTTTPPRPGDATHGQPPSRAGQWIVPGGLAVALVCALVVKLAWWDRRWQGTPEACEVALALIGPEATPEERSDAIRDYFGGSDDTREAFGAGLGRAVMQLVNDGTLSQRGVPATSVDRAYVMAMRQGGMLEAEARATAQAHRSAIVRSVASIATRYTTNPAFDALRVFVSGCRARPSPRPSQASAALTGRSPTPVAAPTPTPPPPAAPQPPPTEGEPRGAPTIPVAVPDPSPPDVRGCVVARQESFHIRPTDVAHSSGRLYPTGTRVEVLARGTITRGSIQSHRVRIVGTHIEGYTFLTPIELSVCTPGGGAPTATEGRGDQIPPPCVANCIRIHRAEYDRCTDECMRGGTPASQCTDGCSLDYHACLVERCGSEADDDRWSRPD